MSSEENRGIFLLVIVLMSVLSLVASDICLPALPEMAIYFDCSQTEIQSSFTLFLLALATCQIVYGFLADRFGRKTILLIGFGVFTVASIGCAFTTTLSEFIFFRSLQALGSGAGSVLSRAIIADRFTKLESVKIFTTIFPIVGLSPAISPFIGGYLTYFFDWRATFFFLAFFGFLIMLLIVIFLKEKSGDSHSKKIQREMLSTEERYGYWDIFRNIEFIGYTIVLCAGYCVFRSYTTESPFVFDNQGYMAEEIGYFYITLSIAYITGNLLAKKLVNRLSLEFVLRIGFFFFASGGVLIALFSYLYPDNPFAIIIPMSIVTIGNGFLFPIGSAAAMSSVPTQFSGSASGLLGALQLSIAALCIHWIGDFCSGNAFPMALYIVSIIGLGLFSFVIVVYGSKIRYVFSR